MALSFLASEIDNFAAFGHASLAEAMQVIGHDVNL